MRLRNEKGQLTIFLGIIMLILITMLAFIVNVGLFVKAKINLQNSVDAAAWSGAAVQARQLTTIGHLNWELRNTYKEWLFKYYVVGQLALSKTKLDGSGNLPGSPQRHAQNDPLHMNFRQDPFDPSGTLMGTTGAPISDPYNAPSVCIHYGQDDICQIYSVPGIPRFDPVGLPGPSEHHEAFVNVLDQQKSQDCSLRSNLNFMTALIWTYGTEQDIPGGNYVASNRPGAWVQSMELAIRVRNLEYLVNSPPQENLCQGGAGCNNVTSLSGRDKERAIKAFNSAYRNLNEEMQATFKLTELKPQPYNTFEAESLSGSLYKGQAEKFYLDLQIVPINYIMFYTSFIRHDGSYSGNLQSTAQCDSSKMALPVPGYVTGFVKNPEVLTYYAVKGEAYFSGLFFPFTANNGILLKAYAAAKPFGGRIGPQLFTPEGNAKGIKVRTGTNLRSLPYISTLTGLPSGLNYKRGYPIPLKDFWIQDENVVIGGIPQGGVAYFGIPNMIYDFTTDFSEISNNSTQSFLKLSPKEDMIGGGVKPGTAWSAPDTETSGLYSQSQYKAFAKNLPSLAAGSSLDASVLEDALIRSRRPTKYEALNYLIPFCKANEVSDTYDLESPPTIPEKCSTRDSVIRYSIYAPIFGPGTLYSDAAEAKLEVMSYLSRSNAAIDNFIDALKETANGIRADGATTAAGPTVVEQAANTIATANPAAECGTTSSTANGLSMAARFHIFFKGAGVACQITPLFIALDAFWSKKVLDEPNFEKFYATTFVPPAEDNPPNMNKFLTAYMPGPRHGVNEDGQIQSPFGAAANAVFAKRNFYSTKFVALNNLSSLEGYGSESKYFETSNIGDTVDGGWPSEDFKNKLNKADLSEFGTLYH